MTILIYRGDFGVPMKKFVASRKGLGARKRRAREARAARVREQQRQAYLDWIARLPGGSKGRPLNEMERFIQSISPKNRVVL